MTDFALSLMMSSGAGMKNQQGQRNPFVIEYYYLIDRTLFLTGLNRNKEKKILISDRPELFPILMIMVRTLKELVNGHAKTNQELVYQLGIDVFMNTLLRIVDDIEDNYYQLK